MALRDNAKRQNVANAQLQEKKTGLADKRRE